MTKVKVRLDRGEARSVQIGIYLSLRYIRLDVTANTWSLPVHVHYVVFKKWLGHPVSTA
jgi:hypothetical protein